MPSDLSAQGRAFVETFIIGHATAPVDAEQGAPGDMDVTPFQKAKAVWEATRKDLNGQMKTLQAAILKRCAEMGITDIKGETDELFRQLAGVDQALEDALQAVIAAPDPDTRDANKAAAGKVADRMLKELNSPFFTAVDSGNGFRNVAVRADAIDALRAVRSLL